MFPSVFVPESAKDVTADWIQNTVLKGHIEKDFKVLRHTAECMTKSDDREGFLSQMIRAETEVQVDGEDNSRRYNFVVKTFPPNEQHRKIVRDMLVFERETHVYTKLIGQIRDAQDSGKTGGKILEPYWPKCYYTCFNPMTKVSAIVMNDLVASGYELMDKKLGLDHAHLLCGMRAFARSHALTFNVKSKVGVERYLLENVPLLDDPLKAMVQIDLTYDVAICRMRSLQEEDLANRMDKYRKNLRRPILQRLLELVQMKGKLSTLIQGDCWINNMMFRDDKDSKKLDVVLFDLQIYRYGNPCLDLVNFLVGSSCIAARQPMDALLKEYYDTFFATLHEVGNPFKQEEYTFEDLKADFETFREFGYIMGLMLIPIMMTEGSDMPNLDAMKDENPAESFKLFAQWMEMKKREPVPKDFGERLLEHVKDMAEHNII